MSFDLFQSRRNYNDSCRWWSRNEDDENEPNELIYKRVPTGYFYAKEVSSEQLRNLNLSGMFRIDSTHTTIKTPDNLDGIKVDDLVEYQEELWRVDNIQKSKAKMQNTYYAKDKYCSHFWFLELKR